MTSAVDICNTALSYLGQAADITSLDPANDARAETMARFYPIARRLLLADHAWSFATKRSGELTDTTSDIDAWGYRFAKPSDMVEPLALLPLGGAEEDVLDFLVEGSYIYANDDTVELRYIYDHENTEEWSQHFCEAASRKLAALAAGTIIRGVDPNLLRTLEQNADIAAAEAKTIDSKRVRQASTYSPPWVRARGARVVIAPAKILR